MHASMFPGRLDTEAPRALPQIAGLCLQLHELPAPHLEGHQPPAEGALAERAWGRSARSDVPRKHADMPFVRASVKGPKMLGRSQVASSSKPS